MKVNRSELECLASKIMLMSAFQDYKNGKVDASTLPESLKALNIVYSAGFRAGATAIRDERITIADLPQYEHWLESGKDLEIADDEKDCGAV